MPSTVNSPLQDPGPTSPLSSDHSTLRRRELAALFWLTVACLLWGPSFTWVKDGSALTSGILEHHISEQQEREVLGPIVFYAHRFLLTSLAWALFFPRSLRGWSLRNCSAGALTGVCLSLGLWLQLFSLRHASASLSAFLTSLTVLCTPLLALVLFRQRVNKHLWLAIGGASIGIALMTSFRAEGGIDQGAILGFLCAVAFSFHYLLVDRFGSQEGVWRFALQQFAVCGAFFTVGAVVLGEWQLIGSLSLYPAELTWLQLLCILPAGVGAFGLMFRFQPDTTPTKAALVFTSEPLFATIYAWLLAGSALTNEALIGGAIVFGSTIYAVLFGNNKEESTL